MSKTFEQIGGWFGIKEEKHENPHDYLKIIVANSLALVSEDAPADLVEQVEALSKLNGFTDALPWKGFKGQIYCAHLNFERLSKAQQMGSSTMTFERELMGDDLIEAIAPHVDGYKLEKPLAEIPTTQKFAVFVKE